ncbi:MAG: hypothetical protein AB1420_00670 [Bacillota bacterium]
MYIIIQKNGMFYFGTVRNLLNYLKGIEAKDIPLVQFININLH